MLLVYNMPLIAVSADELNKEATFDNMIWDLYTTQLNQLIVAGDLFAPDVGHYQVWIIQGCTFAKANHSSPVPTEILDFIDDVNNCEVLTVRHFHIFLKRLLRSMADSRGP